MACEVCGLLEKQICEGCFAGTDERALARLEKQKAKGKACAVLECAVTKKQDYCLRCESFPCDIHYQEIPYSKRVLDIIKAKLGR